jgi:hypothetical protein
MVGVQEPRIVHLPHTLSWEEVLALPLIREVQDLLETAKKELDDWQKFALFNSLVLRDDGKWAAFETAFCESRQNGKGEIFEARELAGVFCIGDRLLIHSAHEFATASEAFIRMENTLEEAGLANQLKPRSGISRSHGMEGFVFKSGQRLRYRTRTKGGGRGFSCDFLGMDEAMVIPEFQHGALLPTLSARPNPQVYYGGSAVDQQVHDDGVVFARIRERGIRGGDPSLAYFEHSAEAVNEVGEPVMPDQLEDDFLSDISVWARANPGLGRRISPEHVANELRSMDTRTFAVERLGVGDWPVTDPSAGIFDMDLWDALIDADSAPGPSICFAFDVSPDRKSAAIGTAGRRSDDRMHVEVVDHKAGTGWLVDRLVGLKRHNPSSFICDGGSPAGSFVDDLRAKGVMVQTRSGHEYADDCGEFFDLVDQENMRHLGQQSLRKAVKGAAQRPLGEAWAWGRKKSNMDITPLVACTLAVGGAKRAKKGGYIMDMSELLGAA